MEFSDRRLYVRRAIVQIRRRRDRPMTKVEQPTKGRRRRRVAISPEFVASSSRPAATTRRSGRRRVAISPEFVAALSDWFTAAVVEGGADATGYVWPGRDGGPMHDRSLARAVERSCARAGLIDAHSNPQITATTDAHLLGDDQLDRAAAAFAGRATVREVANES